ncbi:MAG: hypothetical protein AAB606_00970 [Patescibacteria group bacterium]
MPKKNGQIIQDVFSDEARSDVEIKRSFWYIHSRLDGLIKGLLAVFILVLFLFTFAQAGNVTPPVGAPTAKFYTLSEIYNFIGSSTTATEGGHSFTFSESLTGTGRTLTEIYSALASLISTGNVKSGMTYLGVTGAYPSATYPLPGNTAATDATAAEICNANEAWSNAGSLLTGTLNPGTSTIMSGTTICGVVGTAVASPSFGDNSASKVLTTAGNAGTYNAANLTAANVRNTITFGVGQTGTFSGTLDYGDDSAANVLTTASTPGTYNVSGLSNSVIKKDVTWGVSLGSTGTLVPSGGTAAAADVLSGKTFFGASQTDWNTGTGTMTSKVSSATIITPSTADQAIAQGYYGGVVGDGKVSGDADLAAGNIAYGVDLFGTTGTMSPYPNTPSGISGLNQAVCTTASWTWVADSNYDGVNNDPICVQPALDAAGVKMWNNTSTADNTFIGNYSCSDSESNLETFDAQLNGLVVENTGYGNDAALALAIVDCKDGIRNLLSKAAVETYGYLAPDASCTGSGDNCHDGPLTRKALSEWKGTRLPSYYDLFCVCGDGTTSTTTGWYGTQIGRANNVITGNGATFEWVTDTSGQGSILMGGYWACSYTSGSSNPHVERNFRAVFRP